MSGPSRPIDGSQPAWTLSAPSAAESPEVAAERFTEGMDLGVGGMGRVRLIRDRWLGRDLAIKEPVTAADAGRLWREALITSRLEHPGIVAIYDVGFDERGTPWFAMRVVRGRSLAERLAASPPESGIERTALLRPLLAACEAVGFAHSRGVIHRDLKPSNLMLGAFGEMQVIDWGLASAHDLPDLDLATAGTPAYMSPEQARGEEIGAPSDVWSLGAVLYEVVTGRPARAGTTTEIRAMASRGVMPPIPDATPAPLSAILRRAMAPRPEDRYPDGKALADDLGRYLDGRLVDAHRYTPLELLGRLIRAWRVPLGVMAVALVVLVVLVVVGVDRIREERDQAEANLSLTQVREAQRLWKELRFGEAELLAASAIANTNSARVRAEARGVLAAIGPERPTLTPVADLPCAPVDVAQDLALCRDQDLLRVFDSRGLRFARQVDQLQGRFLGSEALVANGGLIQVFDTSQGELKATHPNPCASLHGMRLEAAAPGELVAMTPHCATLITLAGLDFVGFNLCREQVSMRALTRLDETRLIGACDDETVTLLTKSGGTWERRLIPAPLGTPAQPPVVTAMTGLGPDSALVGFGDGGLARLVLGGNGVALSRLPSQRGLVRAITLFASDTRAAVLADGSGPLILDLERDRALLRLPRPHVGSAADVAGELALVGRRGEGGYLERWELSGLLPNGEPSPRGVNTVAARRDSPAFAFGDGPTLVVLDGERRRVAEHTWQSSIIRTTAFAPSGELFAHGLGSPELRRFDGAKELEAPHAPGVIMRRVAPLADGSLLVSAHIQQQFRVRQDRPAERVSAITVVDLAATVDGHDVVVLLEGGQVLLGRDFATRGELTPLFEAERALAVRVGGDRVFALESDGVASWRIEASGVKADARFLAEPAADLVSLAHDHGRLAAGARDGAIWVWSTTTNEPAVEAELIIRIHEGRADGLAFGLGPWRRGGPNAPVLFSGGWDKVAYWLDPAPTERQPGEVETVWGVALGDVFRAR